VYAPSTYPEGCDDKIAFRHHTDSVLPLFRNFLLLNGNILPDSSRHKEVFPSHLEGITPRDFVTSLLQYFCDSKHLSIARLLSEKAVRYSSHRTAFFRLKELNPAVSSEILRR
jgi:hypothetical protein